jgi:hypothetical protein
MSDDDIRSCETAAQAAAKWWRGALEAPRYDNGSDDEAGLIASMSATIATPKRSSESLDLFETELANAVADLLEEQGDWGVGLGVDYNPDHNLAEAASRAGITSMRDVGWPWKTNMLVKSDEVEVSAGYGAPWKTIWSAQ